MSIDIGDLISNFDDLDPSAQQQIRDMVARGEIEWSDFTPAQQKKLLLPGQQKLLSSPAPSRPKPISRQHQAAQARREGIPTPGAVNIAEQFQSRGVPLPGSTPPIQPMAPPPSVPAQPFAPTAPFTPSIARNTPANQPVNFNAIGHSLMMASRAREYLQPFGGPTPFGQLPEDVRAGLETFYRASKQEGRSVAGLSGAAGQLAPYLRQMSSDVRAQAEPIIEAAAYNRQYQPGGSNLEHVKNANMALKELNATIAAMGQAVPKVTKELEAARKVFDEGVRKGVDRGVIPAQQASTTLARSEAIGEAAQLEAAAQARREATSGPSSSSRLKTLVTGAGTFYAARVAGWLIDPATRAASEYGAASVAGFAIGQGGGLRVGAVPSGSMAEMVRAQIISQHRFGASAAATWGPAMLAAAGGQGQLADLAAFALPVAGAAAVGGVLGWGLGGPPGAAIGAGIGAVGSAAVGVWGRAQTWQNDPAWRAMKKAQAERNRAGLPFGLGAWFGPSGDPEAARGRLMLGAAGSLDPAVLDRLSAGELAHALPEAVAGISARNVLGAEQAGAAVSWALSERHGLGGGFESTLAAQARVGIDRTSIMMQMAGMSGADWKPGTSAFQAMSSLADKITNMPAALQFQLGAQRWSPIANFLADRGVAPEQILALGQRGGMNLSAGNAWRLQQTMAGNPYIMSQYGRDTGQSSLITREAGGLAQFTTSVSGADLDAAGIGRSSTAYGALRNGGMWGLQTQMRQRGDAIQAAELTIQQANINIKGDFQAQGFALEGRGLALNRGFEDWQNDFGKRQIALGTQQFYENLGLNVDASSMSRRQRDEMLAWQMGQVGKQGQRIGEQQGFDDLMTNLNRGWTTKGWGWQADDMTLSRQYQMEDRAFQQSTNERQWGWSVSDMDEAIRRSSGYQRKQLLTQRERATIEHNSSSARTDVLESREDDAYQKQIARFDELKVHQQEIWNLEDQRLALTRKYQDEDLRNQTEMFEMRKRQYAEQDAMEDRRFGLQKEHFEQERVLQEESFAKRRDLELSQRGLEDESRVLRKQQMDWEIKNAQMGLELAKMNFKFTTDAQAAMEALGREIELREAGIQNMVHLGGKSMEAIVNTFVDLMSKGFHDIYDDFVHHPGTGPGRAGGFHGVMPRNAILRVSDGMGLEAVGRGANGWTDVYPSFTPQSHGRAGGSGGDMAGSLASALNGIAIKLVVDGKEMNGYLSTREGNNLYNSRRR